MIYPCLKYIADRLNQNIKHIYHLAEDIVVLTDLAGQGEGTLSTNDNKITITLTNIEKDTIPHQRGADHTVYSGQHVLQGGQPLYINISVVVAAHFTGANYPESLKFVSHLMAFFHRHCIFDHQNSPDMPSGIERIQMEIENIQRNDLNAMWSMLGGRYLPSVSYRIRLVVPDSEGAIKGVSSIRSADVYTRS